MLDHVNVTRISKDFPEELLEELYQGFKSAYEDGETYQDKNLTAQECVDWLSEIDDGLGDSIKRYMWRSQKLRVFTGMSGNDINEVIVLGRLGEGGDWRMLAAGFSVEGDE
ncbi:hypothetical protein [Levilactobacillus brevis]|uniref:hypothetical protein n=1 Tax=Levilactobacillus brevis TaxID=1580 RepID=UPI00111A3DE3|nr:hypothetical protein [Levilactobacillus brevis]QCZ46806.1 Hypothetical protein UCCLB556_1929 [Levilactobacillus brevis]